MRESSKPLVKEYIFYCLLLLSIGSLIMAASLLKNAFVWPTDGEAVAKAVYIIRVLGVAGLILSPGFILGGIMGMARAGDKGRYFFVEQAFYISTIGYPFLYLAGTRISMPLTERDYLDLALIAQAAPILIPLLFFVLTFFVIPRLEKRDVIP